MSWEAFSCLQSQLPSPAAFLSLLANLGKAASASGGERSAPACQSPCLGPEVPGSATQNVLGHLVPTQHLAVLQGPSRAPRCHHWGFHQELSPPVQPHC